MTGFGQASGQWVDENSHTHWSWAVELKSVNHKSLDVRLRAGGVLEALERDFKAKIAGRFARGAFQLSLQYDRAVQGGENTFRIDVAKLSALADQVEALDGRRPTALELIQVRGLIGETSDQPSNMHEPLPDALVSAISTSLDQAMSALQGKRAEEGQALNALLGAQLDDMNNQLDLALREAHSVPDALRQRLHKNLTTLGAADIEPERVAHEIAVLAAKADVTEEIERFSMHVASARHSLASEGPVGRKLEFLAQEFNREANTMCSKSGSKALTNIGLSLKGLVDQWREQVANVE